MKIFVSFRFTGENLQELENTLTRIKNVLEQKGHEVVCSFWREEYYRENNSTNKEILEDMLPQIDSCHAILALIKSSDKSEGMLLEIVYGLAKKKQLILASKNNVKTTFLHEIAEKVIEFETIDDLIQKLDQI